MERIIDVIVDVVIYFERLIGKIHFGNKKKQRLKALNEIEFSISQEEINPYLK